MDTLIFETLPGNRTRLTNHSVCRFAEDRDAMMQGGMEQGINDGYGKSDALLAKGL